MKFIYIVTLIINPLPFCFLFQVACNQVTGKPTEKYTNYD